MADLFESLLPEATWAKGKPGMGEVVSEGARKGYEYLIRPMASPAGMAMGAAFGAAPKALAAAGGAVLGGLGIAQGAKAAEEGQSGLDVALPLAVGAAGLLGLAAAGRSRVARGLLKGKGGRAIPEEALQLALPLQNLLSEKPPTEPTPKVWPKSMQPKPLVAPMEGAQQADLFPHGPIWRTRISEFIDSLADGDGIVDGDRFRHDLDKTLGQLGLRPQLKKRALSEAELNLKGELETFGAHSALTEYMDANANRRRFSADELKAVASLDGFLNTQIYQDLTNVAGPTVPMPSSSDQVMRAVSNPRWFQSTLAGQRAAMPAHDRSLNFDLFVTFSPEAAAKMGWADWGEGHMQYQTTMSGTPIRNPIVRARLSEYVDTENRRALHVQEMQGPFEKGPGEFGESAKLMPEFFKSRVLDIGARRVLRHAIENGYDLVTWNTGRMIESVQGGDFPLIGRAPEGSRMGINWQRVQYGENAGKLMVWSNAPQELAIGGKSVAYNPEELYQAFPKGIADEILSQSSTGAPRGTISEDFPLRNLGWTRKTYDVKLRNIFLRELKVWNSGGPAEEVPCTIYFPDDRFEIAEGRYRPGENPWERPEIYPEVSPTGQVLNPRREFHYVNRMYPEVQLGFQQVHAIPVSKQLMKRPTAKKGSFMSALVPPAVGLGLAASTSTDKGDQR